MLMRLFNSIDLIGCGGDLTNQNPASTARKAHMARKVCKVVGKKSGFYVN